MRTRTIVTTVALGVCLGLSAIPAQAASLNGLTQNGLTQNGSINGFVFQPTSSERASNPGVSSESLPFQSISQQGIGKRAQ
jgi:hypothetical protein